MFSQNEMSVHKSCIYCVPVCSIRMVRRGGNQTTAAWISLRWSGKTKMTLYVKFLKKYKYIVCRQDAFWCILQLTHYSDFTLSFTKLFFCFFFFKLRNAMVNRRTGTFSMEVKKTVDRGVRRQINMFSFFLKE